MGDLSREPDTKYRRRHLSDLATTGYVLCPVIVSHLALLFNPATRDGVVAPRTEAGSVSSWTDAVISPCKTMLGFPLHDGDVGRNKTFCIQLPYLFADP